MRGDGPDGVGRDVEGEVDRALGRRTAASGEGRRPGAECPAMSPPPHPASRAERAALLDDLHRVYNGAVDGFDAAWEAFVACPDVQRYGALSVALDRLVSLLGETAGVLAAAALDLLPEDRDG